ncbi:hypothetical protein MERGE_000584 [Pneumocystis wakefieldiae]|uniref:Serine hydroxymethyltransferase n=1 Tax=Pneumocystis wakefieldiae TaxID=38082 RepID=A0A899G428_9ASCO|nr:hypothetical protein MERGE_000584 [Pneumocystis wakefieldiae]
MSLSSSNPLLSTSLSKSDPEVDNIIKLETKRQLESIVLIPSENFTSQAVLNALGSPMQNKYSEGYPGDRYYGGTIYVDQMELLCQKRALDLYGLNHEEWGVNVQPLSGSPANFYVYTALMKPHEKLMGLDLPDGGHLSHGYSTAFKNVSAVSSYFSSVPYRTDPKTNLINYDELEVLSKHVMPKIIVAGTSSYPRLLDYSRFFKIAKNLGSYLMADMSHISGLVAAGVVPSPFEYADIVTTTTHKSLRGPRGAMIFFRKKIKKSDKNGNEVFYNPENDINFSIFPGHQGGPHNHTISALAVALKQAKTPEFKEYQKQVLKNSKAMSDKFIDLGYDLVTGGTDTHLILIDLRRKGIDGFRVEKVLESNAIPSDKLPFVPSGLRLGSPAMTTRGLKENDFLKIVDFVDRAIKITIDIQKISQSKTLSQFKEYLGTGQSITELRDLKNEVIDWAHYHNVYDDFCFEKFSDQDNASFDSIQESLTSLVKKLKWKIADKDRDKEELFSDYENLQQKYNTLLLSYESLQASSSKQLADMKEKLSFLSYEMNRNMNYLYEELEIKTLRLNEVKQKLEKFKNANRIANEHIESLKIEFNREKSHWEEEKIRLTLSKNYLKKSKILKELKLLYEYFENIKLESLETKEISPVTTSSINIKNDGTIASSFDNFFPSQTLAAELGLCSDKDKNFDSEIFISIGFLDINNSSVFSKTYTSDHQLDKISPTLKESILKPCSENVVYPSTNINASIASSTKIVKEKVSQLTLSTQTLLTKKTSMLNIIQICTDDSLNSKNTHLFESKNYLLKNKNRCVSTATYFSKYQDSRISPPLPIPIRKASLIFKSMS